MSIFHCYENNIEAKNIVHCKDVERTCSAREKNRWIMTSCANFHEKIMMIIVMDNGKGPPARIEILENKDGKLYYLIWSGLTCKNSEICDFVQSHFNIE